MPIAASKPKSAQRLRSCRTSWVKLKIVAVASAPTTNCGAGTAAATSGAQLAARPTTAPPRDRSRATRSKRPRTPRTPLSTRAASQSLWASFGYGACARSQRLLGRDRTTSPRVRGPPQLVGLAGELGPRRAALVAATQRVAQERVATVVGGLNDVVSLAEENDRADADGNATATASASAAPRRALTPRTTATAMPASSPLMAPSEPLPAVARARQANAMMRSEPATWTSGRDDDQHRQDEVEPRSVLVAERERRPGGTCPVVASGQQTRSRRDDQSHTPAGRAEGPGVHQEAKAVRPAGEVDQCGRPGEQEEVLQHRQQTARREIAPQRRSGAGRHQEPGPEEIGHADVLAGPAESQQHRPDNEKCEAVCRRDVARPSRCQEGQRRDGQQNGGPGEGIHRGSGPVDVRPRPRRAEGGDGPGSQFSTATGRILATGRTRSLRLRMASASSTPRSSRCSTGTGSSSPYRKRSVLWPSLCGPETPLCAKESMIVPAPWQAEYRLRCAAEAGDAEVRRGAMRAGHEDRLTDLPERRAHRHLLGGVGPARVVPVHEGALPADLLLVDRVVRRVDDQAHVTCPEHLAGEPGRGCRTSRRGTRTRSSWRRRWPA